MSAATEIIPAWAEPVGTPADVRDVLYVEHMWERFQASALRGIFDVWHVVQGGCTATFAELRDAELHYERLEPDSRGVCLYLAIPGVKRTMYRGKAPHRRLISRPGSRAFVRAWWVDCDRVGGEATAEFRSLEDAAVWVDGQTCDAEGPCGWATMSREEYETYYMDDDDE